MQECCLLQDLPEVRCYTIWAVFIYPAVNSLGFAFLINTILKKGQLLFNLFSTASCRWGKIQFSTKAQKFKESSFELVLLSKSYNWLLSHNKEFWKQEIAFFQLEKDIYMWWMEGCRNHESVILLSYYPQFSLSICLLFPSPLFSAPGTS